MSRIEYLLAAATLRAFGMLFRLAPVIPRKVVFASPRTERLEGNLAFIHARMQRDIPDLEYVFLLRRYSYSLWGKLSYLAALIPATYHLMTADIFVVDNAFLPVHVVPHRSETTVIQVWHAAGALKRFGLDAPSDVRSVEEGFLHANYDYVVVGSEAAIPPYSSALRTPRERVVALGSARADFFSDDAAVAAARARFFDSFPALRGRTIVLYAPTFRGAGTEKRGVDRLDARLLRDRLPDEYALVYRTHPVLGPAGTEPAGYDAVAGDEFELNEVLVSADVLVTDYSSSIFEWALLGRPLYLLIGDIDDYRRDPGFYIEHPGETVGTVVEGADDLADRLLSGTFDASAYDAFVEKHMSLADGEASRRFVEFVEPLLSSE